MKGPYPGWDKDLHFVRSDDLWHSQHTKLVACANQFEVVGQRVSHLMFGSHPCVLESPHWPHENAQFLQM